MSRALLAAELDRWRADGREATLWWRDDDAVAATPALARLLGLASQHAVPLALAVVPAGLDASLVEAVAGAATGAVVQHGYAHRNHAAAGAKACELGGARRVDAAAAELAAGRQRLEAAFGPRFVPVVVPPWNRIDPALVPRLPALGYAGLSTFGARTAREAAPGVVRCNTHADPIRWREGRTFVGADAGLAQVAAHLAARRTGAADPDEPTGLLTHHLVFDDAAWTFVDVLLRSTSGHPSARWIDAREAFAISAPAA
ncbi:MAG TPA: polysaccharide deacetylase family protein [Casimicrobiaceae bacterium]|nr:polysaccharide deacetylase family protein [Casimicrobiaceae bacterium]